MAQTAVELVYRQKTHPHVQHLELVFPQILFSVGGTLEDGQSTQLHTASSDPVNVTMSRSGTNIHCQIQAAAQNLVEFIGDRWCCSIEKLHMPSALVPRLSTDGSTSGMQIPLKDENNGYHSNKQEEPLSLVLKIPRTNQVDQVIKTEIEENDLSLREEISTPKIRECSVSLKPLQIDENCISIGNVHSLRDHQEHRHNLELTGMKDKKTNNNVSNEEPTGSKSKEKKRKKRKSCTPVRTKVPDPLSSADENDEIYENLDHSKVGEIEDFDVDERSQITSDVEIFEDISPQSDGCSNDEEFTPKKKRKKSDKKRGKVKVKKTTLKKGKAKKFAAKTQSSKPRGSITRPPGVLIDGQHSLLEWEDVVLRTEESPMRKKSHKKRPEPLDMNQVLIRSVTGECHSYSCPNCQQTFDLDMTLMQHFYDEHSREPGFPLRMLLLDIYFYDLTSNHSIEGEAISCPYCNRKRDLSVIFDHMKRCHQNRQTFRKVFGDLMIRFNCPENAVSSTQQCTLCEYQTTELPLLLEHFKLDHKLTENYLLKIVDLDEMQHAQDANVGDSETVVMCPFCYKQRSPETISKHLTSCHDMLPSFQEIGNAWFQGKPLEEPVADNQKYQCPDCPFLVIHHRELYRHYRSSHTDLENYLGKIQELEDTIYKASIGTIPHTIDLSECIYCKKVREGRAIFDHIHFCHENIPEGLAESHPKPLHMLCPRKELHMCPFCNQNFKTKGAMYKHSRYECDRNPRQKPLLSCRFCAYHCDTPEQMETHIEMHQDRYVCETCGAQFQYKSSLSYHKRRFHGQGKKLVSHICPVCNLQLAHKSSYKRHLLTHSGLKNHTCETCGKAFSTPSALRNHRNRIHLGAFPYHCDKCGYGIYKIDLLRKHKCGRIRNRGREVGAADDLRAAHNNGIIPVTPKPTIREVAGWKKKRVQPTDHERMPTEVKFPRNLDEFFDKQVAKEVGEGSSQSIVDIQEGNEEVDYSNWQAEGMPQDFSMRPGNQHNMTEQLNYTSSNLESNAGSDRIVANQMIGISREATLEQRLEIPSSHNGGSAPEPEQDQTHHPIHVWGMDNVQYVQTIESGVMITRQVPFLNNNWQQ